MKKVVSILIALLMMTVLFVGCSAGQTSEDATKSSDAGAQAEESAADAADAADATDATDETDAAGDADTIKIGVSFATLQEERWQRDCENMEAKAAELGAELVVQSANGDAQLQNSQCENLITQGVDALVVIAQDSSTASAIVESAHEAGIKVVAHDRLISDCELDYYVTFDCYEVGVIQGQFAVDLAPKGNYFLISGSPTDNNAHLMREGQMDVLQPYIDSGDIKIVVDQWCNGWSPEEALQHAENGLSANNNDVACVLTSNDGTAGAAIQALSEQGLAGQVVVTGLDAELAACQRVVEGTQNMTVYRKFSLCDETAIDIAYMCATGQDPADTYELATTDNGMIDVPSVLLTDPEYMYAATADRMADIIADGWLAEEDIYKNVSN